MTILEYGSVIFDSNWYLLKHKSHTTFEGIWTPPNDHEPTMVVSKIFMIYKIRSDLASEYQRQLSPPDEELHYVTRNAHNIWLPKTE